MCKYLLVALAVFLVATGCVKVTQQTSSGTSTATGQPSHDRLKIVFIPKNSGNPYFAEIQKGFEDAAKELNADFTTSAPAKGDATSQIPIIKDQIQRGVDVIGISANSPDALNQVLDQARAKGIIVVTVDSDLTGNEGHRDAGVLPADFDKIGAEQVELMGSLIGYQGDIAILSATADAPNQNAWIAKMKETLKAPKYAKMKLVDTVYGDDEPQKSATECDGLLSKYPDLKGIISPTSVGLAAAAQSMQLAGVYPGGPNAKNGGVQLTGLSTPKQMAPYVKKGVVQAFALWSPHDAGYVAAYLGAQIKQGKVTAAEGAGFTAGKLGERKIGAKNVVIAGEIVKFDKSNVDQFNY